MLTEKDYCDYDTCVALKELGYIGTAGECSHFGAFCMDGKGIFYDRLYNSELKENECLRVPLYLAQKWLREEKNIIVEPFFAYMDEKRDKYYSVQIVTDIRFDDENYTYECATTKFEESKGYEKALSEGIKEAVKILKEHEAIHR